MGVTFNVTYNDSKTKKAEMRFIALNDVSGSAYYLTFHLLGIQPKKIRHSNKKRLSTIDARKLASQLSDLSSLLSQTADVVDVVDSTKFKMMADALTSAIQNVNGKTVQVDVFH